MNEIPLYLAGFKQNGHGSYSFFSIRAQVELIKTLLISRLYC
ncbi:hypothetical protein FORC066_3585 [Yersinia enterocolitica]|nr:hypothetical protein FORC065_0947 [Yersinia enterocolitica]UXD30792.1 hypothetical protein FORC066_3585 [Yersinia enterocolitica]